MALQNLRQIIYMLLVDEAVENFLVVGNKKDAASGPAFFLQHAKYALDAKKVKAVEGFVENDEVGVEA